MIPPVPHLSDVAAYALAKTDVPVGKRAVFLNQNESLRAPSPLVAQALAKGNDLQVYPDPDWTALRGQLAGLHQIKADDILIGCGSMELISAIAHAYLNADCAALIPAHAYPFFAVATALTGAWADRAAEVDITADSEALLDAVRPETRVLFLANPANPGGTRLSRAQIIDLRTQLRGDILLVLDEAYGEFADHLNEPMFDLAQDNVVVLRSLSKAYGLAGLRVGWGVFPKAIAQEVRKFMNPNNLSVLTQTAASAAVQDHAYMCETCQMTAQLRDCFAAKLRDMGLGAPQNYTNFQLIDFGTAKRANHVDAVLKSEGIFLRPQAPVGLPQCLRATISVADDMDFATDVIKHALESEV